MLEDDAAGVLKNYLEVDKGVEILYIGFQAFRELIALLS